MVRELPRHRPGEEGAAQLRELPQPRPHRALAIRRRAVRRRLQPDGRLLPRQHAGAPAAAGRQRAALARPRARHEGDRGISRLDQPEPGDLVLSAQDAAAPDRPLQPRHHHRIRPAAPADPAARRHRSTNRAWSGSPTSPSSSSARWIPRPARSGNIPLPVLKPGYPVGTLDLEARQGRQSLDRHDVSEPASRASTRRPRRSRPGRSRRNGRPTRPSPGISIRPARMSTARSGSRTPTARRSCGSISQTGQWENLGSFSDPSTASASASTASGPTATTISICSTSSRRTSAMIDAKTKQFTVYRGEIANSRPRRGAVDDQDRLWFAEYAGNAIGMFDPKTEQIKEWVLPTPWAQPYDVVRRQERRGLDRLDDERPRVAARSEDRPVRGVSAAEDHQHPPRVRRQLDHAGDVLGRLATTAHRSSSSSRWTRT